MGGNVTDWVVEVIQRPRRRTGRLVVGISVGVTGRARRPYEGKGKSSANSRIFAGDTRAGATIDAAVYWR
jgi:hypothetical protein